MKPNLLVLLDFDGTLTSIRLDPKKVKLSKSMYTTLEKLVHNKIQVTIISSRPYSFLKQQLPSCVKILGSKGNSLNKLKKFSKQRKHIFRILYCTVKKFPLTTVQLSPCGAEIHFRKNQSLTLSKVMTEVCRVFDTQPVKIIAGRKTVEVIPLGLANKQEIVKKIIKTWQGKIMFIGDDDSDAEAAVEIMKQKGNLAFLVKTKERKITPKEVIKLTGIQEVQKTLKQLL
ncbi:MAG: HAD-IIB family hydrolase [Candidatus Diapherotrites archaeon]|nr:HAD-IIB family hydrolase [Candidatus Diapherotrites archaeon]